jgi:FtsP/CotA-like multicopper oxidase with cupredoxin domain
LRDIQIISTIPPDEANASSAVWVPVADPALCENNTVPASKRLGFCSGSDSTKLWLFTVNGERFPSLSVRSGRNLLLRIGNTSASATYVLSLIDQNAPDVRIPFELLSVDGVVPTIKSGARNQSIAAPTTESIRLMPASRAEIYIRNDQPSSNARRIVLRTEGLHTGSDAASGDNWPEVHLAQIVLEQSPVLIAALSLNLAEHPVQDQVLPRRPFAESPQVSSTPGGCIRDPDSTKLEHRRITFTQTATGWAIRTQIVAPPDLNGVHPIGAFQPDPRATVGPIPFERYLKDDGTVNWDGTDVGSNPRSPKHVCVSLKTGHGQLWEIYNPTRELHNFHIHQSKFRIAAVEDLRRYGIDPQGIITSGVAKLQNAKGTDDLYIWHDTMPIEAQGRVFLVINFDAEEQIGRFVFHCHILEHEDSGLMAPVEVIP